jgi:branched-chain amino acid transport system permease protein
MPSPSVESMPALKQITRWPALPRIGPVLALALACVLPLVSSDYHVFQLTMVLSYAVALIGLNLLTGYNGQISLGHGAFYAIGAYTAAILGDRFGLPCYLTVPCAGLICLGVGFLFGLPALRLDGLYLALATFALGVALPQLLKYKGIESWTGGVQGLAVMKPDAPFGLPLSSDQWLYFVSLAVLLASLWAARNLVESHTGRVLIAIRDNPLAASAMGVDTALYKSVTFGISAMFTGIAGALAALAVQFVAPDSFSSLLSISLLVGIVLGGLASISGAIYGALFIQFVPNLADQISKAAPWALYGATLIAAVYLLPNGIAGLVRQLGMRLRAPSRPTSHEN